MDAVHVIPVVMVSELEHIDLMLQKLADKVWFVPKTGKLPLDAHWTSFNVCFKTAGKAPLYMG